MSGLDWQAPGLAPYQRVLLFLERMGGRKKSSIAHHTNVPLRAIEQMIEDGTIHSKGDGLLHPGKNPNYHGGPNKDARRWNREVLPQ